MKLTRSFSFRMVATTVIAIILSISIAMLLIFMQYRHHMQELDGTHTLHAFSEVETDLMKLLNDANSMALKIQQSKIVSAYLFNNYESDIEKVVAKRDMMAALSEELSEDSGLYGVLFFREDASMVGATLPWRFSFETTQHPFFETGNLDYVPIGQDVIWLGAYPLSEFTLRENYQAEEGNILIIGANRMRYKYNAQNQDTIVLLTAVSISSLEKLYTYLENESSDIYLLDKNGCQISGPDKSHLGEQPSFAASLPANEAYGSFEFKNAHGTDLVIYKLLPDLGWFLAKTVSAEVYYAPIYRLLRQTIVIGIAACALASAIYIFWLTNFLHPFHEILRDMHRVQQGDMRLGMKTPFYITEFEQLRLGINRMIQKFSQMLAHTKEIERSRADLMLRNLQMQINPHMVFNTIAAIRWMAMFSGANIVSDMLMELAELIRPIYSEWRLTWTVREELNYIKHYMRLMELRYGMGFQTHIDVDEALLEAKIPLFTLQPLMENSCEHGTANQKSLSIWITGTRAGEVGCLTVRDNGCGIAPDVLFMLQAAMREGSTERYPLRHIGIGIVNIDRRIKTFSGEGSGLSIESVEGEGTTIYVRFSLELH